MILAILTKESDAVKLSEDIHDFLTQNRPRYNAVKWANINKSDFEEKWMVKIPYDFEKWKVKLDITKFDKVDKLDVWKELKEIKA